VTFRWAALATCLLALTASRAAAADPDYGIAAFFGAKYKVGLIQAGQPADVRGVKIYYEIYGGGPPVLVLHGGAGFLETMHNQIAALAPRHEVIAPDSRAHGRSTDGPGPLRYHDMAEDMIALMDRLHIAKADLVGWSDGGIIGLDLAMRHPGRIGRMVVIGTNYDLSGLGDQGPLPSPNDADFASRREFYQSVSPTPDHWAAFVGKVTTMWRTQPNYTLKQLGRIKSPVLVMAGERDGVLRAHTDALARAIPGAKEAIIPGADHLAPLTHPDEVDAAIVAFLDGPGLPAGR